MLKKMKWLNQTTFSSTWKCPSIRLKCWQSPQYRFPSGILKIHSARSHLKDLGSRWRPKRCLLWASCLFSWTVFLSKTQMCSKKWNFWTRSNLKMRQSWLKYQTTCSLQCRTSSLRIRKTSTDACEKCMVKIRRWNLSCSNLKYWHKRWKNTRIAGLITLQIRQITWGLLLV